MRRILAVVAILVACALAWFALRDRQSGRSEPLAPSPETPVDAGPLSRVTVDEVERESVPTASAASSDASMFAAVPAASERRIDVVVLARDGGAWTEGPHVEVVDELGLDVALKELARDHRRIESAPPGRYRARAFAKGYVQGFAAFEVGDDEREKRVEIVLERARVVRVRWQTDDGRPFLETLRSEFPDLRLSLTICDSKFEQAVGSTLQGGTSLRTASATPMGWTAPPRDAAALVEFDPKAELHVHAVLASTILAHASVAEGQEEVVLRSPVDAVANGLARLRFCVVDAATQFPVTDASFTCSNANTHNAGHRVAADGCSKRVELVNGEWRVTIVNPSKATAIVEVDLEPGADVDLGTIALERRVRIVIEAKDEKGAPVPKTSFKWALRGSSIETGILFATDEAGRTKIDAAPRSQVQIVCIDRAWTMAPTFVDLRAVPDGTDEIVVGVTLVPGVVVAIERALGTPASRSVVRTPEGDVVALTYSSPLGVTPLRLLPGTYVVEIGGESNVIHVGAESSIVEWR